MGYLLAVRHASESDTLTSFDAGVIIALYLSIHDIGPRQLPALGATAIGGSSGYMVPRKNLQMGLTTRLFRPYGSTETESALAK